MPSAKEFTEVPLMRATPLPHEGWHANSRDVITGHESCPAENTKVFGCGSSASTEVVRPDSTYCIEGGSPTLRRGLAAILCAAGMHPDTASHNDDSLENSGTAAVTVVVHDRGEPPRPLIRAGPRLHVTIAAASEERTLVAALAAGYHGAIDIGESPEGIVIAVQAALNGQCTLPYEVARRLASGYPPPNGTLDPQEVTWLNRLIAGSSVLELAESEAFSERAMYRRLSEVYQRLGVASRTEAIAVASRAGLLGNRSMWRPA